MIHYFSLPLFLHVPRTHFWDHSRFMPDWVENACSISCCSGERVGTGLEEGVGAGMAKALWISSGLAFRTNSSSFTMHSLEDEKHLSYTDNLILPKSFLFSLEPDTQILSIPIRAPPTLSYYLLSFY